MCGRDVNTTLRRGHVTAVLDLFCLQHGTMYILFTCQASIPTLSFGFLMLLEGDNNLSACKIQQYIDWKLVSISKDSEFSVAVPPICDAALFGCGDFLG